MGVIIRFNDWFYVYDHWYLKLFWVGLLAANLLEWVFLWQVYKYGRKELCPGLSTRAFVGVLIAGLLIAEVMHEFFKHFFGDPLFQLDPTLTMLIYPACGAVMMLSRRSTAGQSVTMWWTFTAMTLIFHATCFIWFGGVFQTWAYAIGGGVATLGGAIMTYVVAQPSERRPFSRLWG